MIFPTSGIATVPGACFTSPENTQHCKGMEKCLCRFLLTSCALFARLAPKALNAAVIGRYYLAFFAGNAMVGRVGELYSSIPTTQFWLLHAG